MPKIITYERPFLRQLKIINLKGLKDVTIDFVDGNDNKQWVTGIFGKNGSGKTTILQSLVCLYQNIAKTDDWRLTMMSKYFKTVNGVNWTGSKYDATFEYLKITKEDSTTTTNSECKTIGYSKNNQKWHPLNTKKYKRNVYYISITSCVPAIETIGVKCTNVTFDCTNPRDLNEKIIQYASRVTGFRYQLVQSVTTWKNPCFVVQRVTEGGDISYHSFAMGAGEQRIFRLIEQVVNAPKYSLIVIDEIDLTLHTDAIKKLIKCLYEIAQEKETQIIFSSHRQELMDLSYVNTYFLLNTIEGITCLHNPTSDCYEELTGESSRDLHVFVEDELSKTIVEHELIKRNKFSRSTIKRFGAAINGFAIAAGIVSSVHEEVLMDSNICPADKDRETLRRLSKYIIILDGDEYCTEQGKIERINKVLTGDDEHAIKRRGWMLTILSQYNSISLSGESKKKVSPDVMIHEMLQQLLEAKDFGNEENLIRQSYKIQIVEDTHDYTRELEKQNFRLADIVSTAMRSNLWSSYVSNLTEWVELVDKEIS